ncbi:hypothetical protein CANCADRAFT_365 [Tortispora caseinolytica NRRL Y-17796]|uniref:NADH dehydrogenase [ubiquinone] 1 alpha subcomplex subunit 5 n=1 Tax=Tortispora caseinolytica NRRL Y-17796 TaxID=767744 RepID=A0A1E4TJ72_9ASCO|nr:hypothetical protein CANCADRAFT_365 [Tortispora caseinolytica NRRL Y-17796]
MRGSLVFRNIKVRATSGAKTGLTGIYAHPEPRPALLSIYTQTLKSLEDIPKDSVYYNAVHNLTTHRKKVVEETESVSDIEQKLGDGLIEELLISADKELKLLERMKEFKPWDPLVEEPPADQWKYHTHD